MDLLSRNCSFQIKGKTKRKALTDPARLEMSAPRQQPQGIAISILLKLYPKINGKILGIAKFGLQS